MVLSGGYSQAQKLCVKKDCITLRFVALTRWLQRGTRIRIGDLLIITGFSVSV